MSDSTPTQGGPAERTSTWDGTSHSGMDKATQRAPDQGQDSPPIRGTATSALDFLPGHAEEEFIWRSQPPQPNQGMWPYSGAKSSLTDADAQATVTGASGSPPATKALP